MFRTFQNIVFFTCDKEDLLSRFSVTILYTRCIVYELVLVMDIAVILQLNVKKTNQSVHNFQLLKLTIMN
jgi:hypothetical protein